MCVCVLAGGAPGDNIAASNPFEDPQPRHAAPPTPPAPHRNHQPGSFRGDFKKWLLVHILLQNL